MNEVPLIQFDITVALLCNVRANQLKQDNYGLRAPCYVIGVCCRINFPVVISDNKCYNYISKLNTLYLRTNY